MTIQHYTDICEYLDRITLGTEWEGHLYAVGGCCRDSVSGREINDVDIAVDLPNGGVYFAQWLDANGFTTRRPVIFPVYGTARLTLRKFPHDEIELVQTRRGKYDGIDPETPEAVHGNVADDALRRDLTMNSLYYDIRNKKMLDPTGHGLEDIRKKILRTPMKPELTFDDDPIRILRVIRFAATLGWTIAPEVYKAMRKSSGQLKRIKIERIRSEFEKMLVSPRPRQAIEMLRHTGAIRFVIPELADLYGRESGNSTWEAFLKMTEAAPPSTITRSAALLHGLASTPRFFSQERDNHSTSQNFSRIASILHRFKYEPGYIDSIIFLIRNLQNILDLGNDIKKIPATTLRKLKKNCGGRTRLNRLLAFAAAYCTAFPSENFPDIEKLRLRLLAIKA